MKNLLFRAVKYLRYTKWKSILLICLFLILSSLTIFSEIIKSTVYNYSAEINNQNGISVTVRAAMQQGNFRGEGTEITDLQQEEIENLLYVNDVSKSAMMLVDDADIISLESESSTTTNNNMQGGMGNSNNMKMVDMLRIQTSTHLEFMDVFQNNTIEVVDGQLPTDANEVLVNSNLAYINNLEVGDTFNIISNSEEITIEVKGIYDYIGELDEFAAQMMPENTMYATYSTLVGQSRESYIYYINEVEDFEQFKIDYADIINGNVDELIFNINDDLYTSTIVPLNDLNETITLVRNIIIVLAAVILIIILAITIKDRTYEIGVLYSISERKKNIVWQFIIEVTLLLTIGFIIALGINIIFDENLINYLLEQF